VHGEPDVPLAAERRVAGVDPDPHAHFLDVRPLRVHERALHGGGRPHGRRRVDEDEEETVALAIDLDSVVRLDRAPDDLVVQRHNLLVSFAAELAQHPSRAFDVGEEKGDSPDREGGRVDHSPVDATRAGGRRQPYSSAGGD
jgi:hypothetical protein